MVKKIASFFDNTNLEIIRRGRNIFKDMAEALRFQGVVRLATRFYFGKRDEICSTVGSKYMSLLSLVRMAWAVIYSSRYSHHRDTQNNRHPDLKI